MRTDPASLAVEPKTRLFDKLESALLAGRLGRRAFVRSAIALGMSTAAAGALADALDEARANQEQRAAKLLPEYDYIVCGGGTAGCVIAARLAAGGPASVLLVEAGDWDSAPSVLDPRLWFTNLGTERDWGDIATPSPGVNGRAIAEHMGRVLGGGSSINATIWVRGHRNDYEHWAEQAGDPGWGYESMLRTIRAAEDWQGPEAPRYRGKGGPVWIEPSQNPLPVAPAMLEAVRSLGLPTYADLNGEREESIGGFALMNHIIRDGRRRNMAQSYLHPVLARPNLTVLTRAHVDRLTLRGTTVTGIELVRHDRRLPIRAAREVILAQGAINTPKLLMLSGIGDRDELRRHGIRAVAHSPDVGRHFQDHILHGGCLWEFPSPTEHRNSGAEASGFWKSDSRLASPDLNLVQIELPYTSDAIAKEYAPPASSWALCAGLVAPKSRGRVLLRSAHPNDRPIVEANFLSHPDDVKALMRGIELCREIGNAKPLAAHARREAVPGRRLGEAALADFVRNGATTFFHQVGTCRMGKDARAVVDARLRVNGVERLRVADGSIMPRIVSAATMASCVFIGERMAQMLVKADVA